MNKPKLIIFASGSKTGGGSGFENLVKATHSGILDAEIVAVVSNHENGGVREKADRLRIPFRHFTGPWTAEEYQRITQDAEWVALSGWLRQVAGLDPRKTFNIHPGPLPRFGGPGMYGHHVHEAVISSFRKGEITDSAVSMHFVTKEYDEGPKFLSVDVKIRPDDTAETLGFRVNLEEHKYQPIYTNLVIHEKIKWDGKDPSTLEFIV